MAEAVSGSDSDGDVNASCTNPPPKRRRIIDPSTITAVPIYSNKVNRSLQLKPAVFKPEDLPEADEEDANLWSPSKNKHKQITITLSDSDEEPQQDTPQEVLRSPSPPPPQCIETFKTTKRASKKIREINKKLDEIGSLMCPSPERPEVPEHNDSPSPITDDDDDDIIIVSSSDKQKMQSTKPARRKQARQISLKFRWRTEVYRIPVLSTDPLSKAVDQLSVKMKAPSSQILLLKKDSELPVNSTPAELDLGIADIIDCVVITEDKDEESSHSSSDVITVRLQSKEKGSAQEYSLHKDAPLGPVLSQYISGLSATAKRRVKFLFDGQNVTPNQTPSQLDMEDGDVIEVWA